MAYESKYSAKERQAYHNRQAKKGATTKDGKPLSDFARGVHKAKADEILKQRRRVALKNNSSNAFEKL